MNAPITFTNISKQYGSHHALKDVSFALQTGEIFGLIGVNGAGKTTLIKSALDLIRADKGHITLAGVDSQQAKSRNTVHYLPEKFMPYPSLTGWDFLKLTCKGFGIALDKTHAEALADALALRTSALGQSMRGYSKGMGQKIGLLSILLCKRDLLILDEPMSGLDPEARQRLRTTLLKEKNRQQTLFFSSHILSDIELLCDRIGLIHDGELRYIGTVRDLLFKHECELLEEAFLAEINTAAPALAA